MELLKSKKFKLPTLYFVDDREEIKKIPIGVPFIYGNIRDKGRIIRILEYEVIWTMAIKSGFPFNFKVLLQEAGFKNVKFHDFCESVYMDYNDSGDYDIDSIDDADNKLYDGGDNEVFAEFVEDCSAYVDLNILKQLNVFPTWLADIEKAIETNVHNFAIYNPYMYNKRLDGMYGSIEMSSPNKNLIIIDISASIPKAVGTTCLTLAKHLVETFYADLMVTGAETYLFPYEEIDGLDIEGMYSQFGNNNESKMYRALVTGEHKKYATAIVFGDNHTPVDAWTRDEVVLSRETAQKMCNWTVEKMISLHTTSSYVRAGYGDFFKVSDIQYISDWVKYIKQ